MLVAKRTISASSASSAAAAAAASDATLVRKREEGGSRNVSGEMPPSDDESSAAEGETPPPSDDESSAAEEEIEIEIEIEMPPSDDEPSADEEEEEEEIETPTSDEPSAEEEEEEEKEEIETPPPAVPDDKSSAAEKGTEMPPPSPSDDEPSAAEKGIEIPPPTAGSKTGTVPSYQLPPSLTSTPSSLPAVIGNNLKLFRNILNILGEYALLNSEYDNMGQNIDYTELDALPTEENSTLPTRRYLTRCTTWFDLYKYLFELKYSSSTSTKEMVRINPLHHSFCKLYPAISSFVTQCTKKNWGGEQELYGEAIIRIKKIQISSLSNNEEMIKIVEGVNQITNIVETMNEALLDLYRRKLYRSNLYRRKLYKLYRRKLYRRKLYRRKLYRRKLD